MLLIGIIAAGYLLGGLSLMIIGLEYAFLRGYRLALGLVGIGAYIVFDALRFIYRLRNPKF